MNNEPAATEGAVRRRNVINAVVTFVYLLNIRFFWGFFCMIHT